MKTELVFDDGKEDYYYYYYYYLFSIYGKQKNDISENGKEYTTCVYFSDRAAEIVLNQIYSMSNNLRIWKSDNYIEYFD